MPFLNDLLALLNGSVAIVAYTQCNNPQCPCGRWDSRANMRNSGGNTLVQLSRMILGAWSPSATGKIFCRFCAWCISAGNAPCAKPAKGMQQRLCLCLHGTIAPLFAQPYIAVSFTLKAIRAV